MKSLRFTGLTVLFFVCLIVADAAGQQWWNPSWQFRVPVSCDAAGYARTNKVAEVAVNFTQLLTTLGLSGILDEQSLRVVEVNGSGVAITDTVPFQFDKDADYNASTKASGSLLMKMEGATSASGTRTYHVYFNIVGVSYTPRTVAPQVTITDNIMDEEQLSFLVAAGGTTYYYHKQGGGFSSLLDSDGNDWLDYHPGLGDYGEYRGIPNAVFPDGHYHPGKTSSVSSILRTGPIHAQIRSVTTDGLWECTWDFYPDYATMAMTKTAHAYWWLYEGTPGGFLNPARDIVVRSDGTQTLASEAWSGDIPGDEWVYFGDPDINRSLFMVHHEGDAEIDSYAPASSEGAMTVFGFGRSSITSYLMGVRHFTIGLIPTTGYSVAAPLIASAYKPLNVGVGAPLALQAPQAPGLVSPPDGSTAQMVPLTVVWNSLQNVARYHLQVSTAADFSGGFAVDDSTVSDTARVVSALAGGTTYYWRVRGKNAAGSGPYSSVRSFTTATSGPPPTPQLLSPPNGASGVSRTPLLIWKSSGVGVQYRLQLATDSSFSAGLVIDDSLLTDTTRATMFLAGSTTYYWRVRAGGSGNPSEYSPTWRFLTAPGATPPGITLVSPANGAVIGVDSVLLVWNKVLGSVRAYVYERSPDSLFQFFTLTDSTTGDTARVARNLPPNMRLFWRVRAGNADGWGAYSETRSFTVLLTEVGVGNDIPEEYRLGQNYPNPFNPTTSVQIAVPRLSQVTVEVFTVSGERVATLVNRTLEAGAYTLHFDARDLPSGLYLCRLTSEGTSLTRKMLLLK